MPEFTETYQFDFENSTGFRVQYEFGAETYNEVVENFVRFLKASGYTYISGITVHTDGGNDQYIDG